MGHYRQVSGPSSAVVGGPKAVDARGLATFSQREPRVPVRGTAAQSTVQAQCCRFHADREAHQDQRTVCRVIRALSDRCPAYRRPGLPASCSHFGHGGALLTLSLCCHSELAPIGSALGSS
jgi:hypothetical protein